MVEVDQTKVRPEYTMFCYQCSKRQEVLEEGSFTGFAGGTSFWYKLACGHTVLDESDDVRAAR
jgi:hypothetical protein